MVFARSEEVGCGQGRPFILPAPTLRLCSEVEPGFYRVMADVRY
jgi:hypothetical protein